MDKKSTIKKDRMDTPIYPSHIPIDKAMGAQKNHRRKDGDKKIKTSDPSPGQSIITMDSIHSKGCDSTHGSDDPDESCREPSEYKCDKTVMVKVRGPRGERGPRGHPGTMGPRGERGERGPRGERGYPGECGKDGRCGDCGPCGDKGPTGPTGHEGPRGKKGHMGEPGPEGIPGTRILNGEGPPSSNKCLLKCARVGDYYIDTTDMQLYQKIGSCPTVWKPLGSLKGDDGPPGADGPTGSMGHTGHTGYTGHSGNSGGCDLIFTTNILRTNYLTVGCPTAVGPSGLNFTGYITALNNIHGKQSYLFTNDQGDYDDGFAPLLGGNVHYYRASKSAFRMGGVASNTNNNWDPTTANVGRNSAGFGFDVLASGENSLAAGYLSHTTAPNSFSFGYMTKSTARHAFSTGIYSVSSGLQAVSHGNKTLASGENSMAIGFETHSSGREAFSQGYHTRSQGEHSIALGEDTTAIGNNSISSGYLTMAGEHNSFAGGCESETRHECSLAHGIGLRTTYNGGAVVGRYNDSCTEALFAVGCGTSDMDRSNAFHVSPDCTNHFNKPNMFHDTNTFRKGIMVCGDAVIDGKLTVKGNISASNITTKNLTASDTVTTKNLVVTGGTGSTVMMSGSLDIAGNMSTAGNVNIQGSISKHSGTFMIPHPDPSKTKKYTLSHSFVESPTAGDNIYRYNVNITEMSSRSTTDSLFYEIIPLPDYFTHLNTDAQIWVNPQNHMGRGYGVIDPKYTHLTVYCDRVGGYNILVIATRKDIWAVNNWLGVEREME